MLRLLNPRRAAVAGVLGIALLGAACSSNDAGTTGTQTPAASPTTAVPMTASGPFGAACAAVPASGAGSLDALAQEPVATAASNTPELSTLVTAVKKADLVNTLNSAQGITVFAPTNDAFAAVPKPTLDKALDDPNGLLTTVLPYHVVPGQLTPRPARRQPQDPPGQHPGGHRQRPGLHRQRQLQRGLRQHPDRQRHRLPHRPGPPPQQLTTHTTQPSAATGTTMPVAAPAVHAPRQVSSSDKSVVLQP